MKIRIFALAKELDMDSKLLIDYCARAGVVAKNALATISPEERDQVINYIKSHEKPGGGGAARPLTPTREDMPDVAGKVRTIKTMTARPQPARLRPLETSTGTAVAELETSTPETESITEIGDTGVVEHPPVRTPDVVPAEAAELETAEPEVAEGSVAETPEAEEAEEAEAATTPAEPERRKAAPLSREDYVPASGSLRSIRPMHPRGTPDSAARPQPPDVAKKPKPKPKVSLPHLATPTYKAPLARAGKPEEAPAQKPDLKLSPEVLQKGSPLADHLKKHADKKKGKKTPEEVLRDERAKEPRKPIGPAGERVAGLGLEESRKERHRKRQLTQHVSEEEEEDRRTRALRHRRQRAAAATQLKTSAQIDLPITVRSLSEALGRPAKSLMSLLFQRGQMATINAALDKETAMELAMEVGVDLQIRREKDVEELLLEATNTEDSPESLAPRPPVITILGHVDHGKTTLVDKLRSSNVAAGEAGGITQHIAAYQVDHNGHKLTFVDTPGHAAFGEMRARGANVTDIVVLVVAANDGVMPQTVECIAHARAAGVPMVVAMNKIDLPEANEQKVLQELSAQNVLPAEWGGDTEVVRTSGMTGQGLDQLLETLLLTAELHDLRSNPDRAATGTCLEAFRTEGRGPVAWLIVQRGTLRVGDVVLCGEAYGRIRAMYNDRDEELTEAGPSMPVKVSGLDIVPGAGDHFVALDDIEAAREIAETRRQRGRAEILSQTGKPRTLDDILNAAREGQVQDLSLIIKADTPGSLEALHHEISKFEHPEVRVKILHQGVGGVNESDVALAGASHAVIIAFHVVPEDRAEQLAQQAGVDIQRYNIIYEVTDHIRQVLEGMLRPERVEVTTGRALVLQTFSISKYGTIAGCRVLNGTIDRNSRVHLIRDQKVLNDYGIASLRREKDDVREVREGMECGIRLEGFNDIKEGDLFEAYRIDEIKRTL